MRENIKRRMWYPLVLLLVEVFTYPVLTAMVLADRSDFIPNPITDKEVFGAINEFLGVTSFSQVFAIFFGAMAAIQGFSYLYNRKKVDMYHSVPVSKQRRFWIICINSLLMYAVIHLTCILLALAIATGYGFMTARFFGWAMMGVFFCLISFITGFALTLLAVMLTGNFIVTILGTVVLAGYEVFVKALLEMHLELFFEHHSYYSGSILESELWFSPIITWVSFATDASWMGPEAIARQGIFRAAMGETGVWGIVKTVIQIVALMAISYVLYRKRSSEAAGRAIAYPKIKQPLKVLMLVPISLAVGGLFYSSVDSMGFELFGLIVGLLIGHSIIEMIYEFDLKAPLRHLPAFGFSAAMTAVIISFFVFDFTGYDSYVPKPEKLEYAAVYVHAMQQGDFYEISPDGFSYRGDLPIIFEEMQIKDVDLICALGEAGAVRRDDYDGMCTGEVRYHLKNGKDVYRRIFLDAEKDSELIGRLVTNQDYVTGAYQLNYEEFAGILDNMTWEYENALYTYPDTKADIRELYDTFRREFNGRSYAMMYDEVPVGQLTFNLSVTVSSGGKRVYTWRYPVYREFTNTVDFLETHAIPVEEELDASQIVSLVIDGPEVNLDAADPEPENVYTYTWSEWEFTEQEEIEEIIPYLRANVLMHWVVSANGSRYSADVMLQDGTRANWWFEKGKLPDILLEKLAPAQ